MLRNSFVSNLSNFIGQAARACAILVALDCYAGAQVTETPPAASQPLQMLGTIRSKDISESSGLAISNQSPDAFWTLNDSGHDAELFLIAAKGNTLATCKLKGARNRDWEAMGSFEQDEEPWLMVADVGDNSLNRTSCRIYLFPEAHLSSETVPSKKKSKKKRKKRKDSPQKLVSEPMAIDFRYEDGPHNVEAAAVSPDAKSIWFIEKIYSNDGRAVQPGIYRLPIDPLSKVEIGLATATRIADFPIRNVTGMSFSPDGHRLIVRNYLNAHLFTRAKGQTWQQTVNAARPVPVAMPLQSQGEAICFTADSKSAIVTSEFTRSAIWKVALPPAE